MPSQTSQETLSISDAARETGMSYGWLWELCKNGDIPTTRGVNGYYRIDRTVLNEFCEARRRKHQERLKVS